jgi:hypothetical protein
MSTGIVGHTLLDQFRVDAFIASGGMGAVYRVWDLKRNVPLAMKVLHADLADDPSMFKRFQREARALQRLAHPNIVPFYGLYHAGDLVFLLERFIDGPSLKDILRSGKGSSLPVDQALVYLKAVSSALGYAHAHGVVHCDVKPGNVMVDRGGSVYLTDFGVARHAESTTTTLGFAGTAGYMAPEQVRGDPVSPATDVYALGVTLYEMLTGERPFLGDEQETEGKGTTGAERVRWAHLHLAPPDPRMKNAALPPELAQVILKALNKQAEGRWASTREFFAAACAAAQVEAEATADRVALMDEGASPLASLRSEGSVAHGGSQVAVVSTLGSLGRVLRERPLMAVVAVSLGIVGLVFVAVLATSLPADRATGEANRTSNMVDQGEHEAGPNTSPSPSTIGKEGLLETTAPPTGEPELPVLAAEPTPTAPPRWRQGRLAYVSNENGTQAIYVLDLETSSTRLLSQPEGSDRFMAPWWSPDGSKIASYIYRGPLTVLDSETGEVVFSFPECASPTWAPDGEQIVCGSNVGGKAVFEVINTITGDIVRLDPSVDGALLPAWSPNREELAFARLRDGQSSIWIFPFSTGKPIVLADMATENYAPAWSPDGSELAYQSDNGSDESEIWVMDSDGRNPRRVTYTDAGWSRAPSWSPDGRWLAFVSSQEGSAGADLGEIFAVSVDTGEVVQITATGGGVYDWRVSWGR